MSSLDMNLGEDVQALMQLAPESLPQTPPLRPFDWWESFSAFNVPESPAVLNGCCLLDSALVLLAPFGQKINNYEDQRIFNDIVAESRQQNECAGCILLSVIDSLISYLEVHEDPKKFEKFIGATIQDLDEWSELDDYQVTRSMSLVGSSLRQLGRYVDALPILTRSLTDIEGTISHNDLAHYRVQLAACYLTLNQVENAVAQLQHTFGPEYGRLAILGPEQNLCNLHGRPFRIEPRLIKMESNFIWEFIVRYGYHGLADIEMPAGTFCLEHEIITPPVIDETSTLYSTIFFSTVMLRHSDVAILLIASEIVRELHRRSAATHKGFEIRRYDAEGSRITEAQECE
jgi:hypothetical protein